MAVLGIEGRTTPMNSLMTADDLVAVFFFGVEGGKFTVLLGIK